MLSAVARGRSDRAAPDRYLTFDFPFLELDARPQSRRAKLKGYNYSTEHQDNGAFQGFERRLIHLHHIRPTRHSVLEPQMKQCSGLRLF
jgi:hypothetical protein